MTTLLETLTKGAKYLESKGVDSARYCMELMAAQVLEMERMQLYLQFDRLMGDSELAQLREMLKKRGARVPLQHLLGSVEFYRREFKCDARALIPRPETEELVAYALNLDLPENPKILDLCSGSGVIGITLKAELGEAAELSLADISPSALALSRENADALGVEVELIHSDLFTDIADTYDLIISNPPYVSTQVKLEPEVGYDPALALYAGAEGMDILNELIPMATQYLNPRGWLVLEIGYDQAEAVSHKLSSSGYQEVHVEQDIDKIPRFPVARWGGSLHSF